MCWVVTLGLALPVFERDIARGTKTQKDRQENTEQEQGNTETCVKIQKNTKTQKDRQENTEQEQGNTETCVQIQI